MITPSVINDAIAEELGISQALLQGYHICDIASSLSIVFVSRDIRCGAEWATGDQGIGRNTSDGDVVRWLRVGATVGLTGTLLLQPSAPTNLMKTTNIDEGQIFSGRDIGLRFVHGLETSSLESGS